MLHLFRRHQPPCIRTDPYWKKCKCPVWVRGVLDGRPIKHSLKVRSWERAAELAKEMEAAGRPRPELVKVPDAISRFLADCKSRNLAYRTIKKYRAILHKLTDYCEHKGLVPLKLLTVDNLREFRESWDVAPVSAYKDTEYLKTFFRFCHDSEWITTNPAKPLKKPVIRQSPTLPFTEEQFKNILDSAASYGTKPKRLVAFILVMRWTGLRISDVVTLRRDAVDGNKVFIRTMKTGVQLHCPVPPEVIAALQSFEPAGTHHFFWNGGSGMNSILANWHRALAGVFKAAKVVDGHSHRFRDTFSCSLLSNGASLETVSELLGHNSLAVTKKHYAPWIKARQDHLESEVMKTWQQEKPKLVRVK